MLNSAKALLQAIQSLIDRLNSTSLKRLVLYFLLIYPLFVLHTYRAEISLLLTMPTSAVQLHDVAAAQERCFKLKNKHGAESVLLYIYQPAGKNKTYKERVMFSTGKYYTPLQSMQTIQLFTRSRILEDLRKDNCSIITVTSGHHESSILQAYNLDRAYVTSIRDNVSEQIIGEVVWIFKDEMKVDVQELVREGQIFAYDINQ